MSGNGSTARCHKPIKPPVTRNGRTHKVVVGELTAYVTVNRNERGEIIEFFAKSNVAQGHVDMVCKAWSVGLQRRADVDTIIRHMRGDRTEPCGHIGQPTSAYDAIARVLEEERDGGGCGASPRTVRRDVGTLP